jgi:hypothetical protein
MRRLELINVLLLSLSFLITACTENEMLNYENAPAIYFAGNATNRSDSINHSFFVLNSNIVKDTVRVRVNTMGELSSQDRPVTLIQTNVGAEGAAVAGIHYVPFDDATLKPLLKVPAGKEFADIPVVLIRDNSLDTVKVRLELGLVGNEYFRPGVVEKQRFVLTTTDLVEKPGAWDIAYATLLGKSWGPVKMRFLIDVTGYTNWYTMPAAYEMIMIQYFGALVRQKLLEYNADHPDEPLREANGNLVSFN